MSALVDAPDILARAEAGTLGRGEQDVLVRFERPLPGFGGLFISQDGQVNVYMKSSTVAPSVVRNVLEAAYSRHPNPLVREALVGASQATILPGEYALSELIAIAKRIESRLPGWSGVGVSIKTNGVRVTFVDSAALLRASSAIASIGVPLGALSLAVTGPISLESQWTSKFRPTGGGIEIGLGNDTRVPGYWAYDPWGYYRYYYIYASGSLGYNVQTSSLGNYFMTASHLANTFYAVNGALGDTVWQSVTGMTRTTDRIGTITVNPPWGVGAACPINPETQTNYDFCTTADVMLGPYFSGVTYARKVGTSVTGGVNGNAGSQSVNGFYTINGVLSPEYTRDTLHHDANKSGKTTGTTSGAITTPMADLAVPICWPISLGCVKNKVLFLQNITEVHAAHGGGDSGGAVFTGNPNQGSPYAALGILVGGVGSPGETCTGDACYYIFARWDMIEARLGLGTLNPKTTIP
jgi:hypothetical protein